MYIIYIVNKDSDFDYKDIIGVVKKKKDVEKIKKVLNNYLKNEIVVHDKVKKYSSDEIIKKIIKKR